VAPALHSFIIHGRKDGARILGILFERHVDIRKLILKGCNPGEDSTAILTNIVALYPDLEALTIQACSPLHSAAYSLIPCLKKLSELELLCCEVHYVYVQL
jgi:hypothetical protein